MTDLATDTPAPRAHTAPRQEYLVYFALILVLSLPFAAIGWALAMLGGETSTKGPLGRALSHARTITPQIFNG